MGSAKKKLSKAEKEKLKQEEEERKAAEDEEAQLRAVEEEKQKKQREQLEETEKRKTENAEKENRRAEMLLLQGVQEGDKTKLTQLHQDRRTKAKWSRYMRCDGSPDPTVPGEINTYINLRLEDTEHNDIKSVLKQSDLDLNLISELDFLLEDTPETELSPFEADRYKCTKEDIQKLLQVKLDAATVMVLQQASELSDTETFNLQYITKNTEICLCIWGNLSKNPRVKSFEFPEKGFQFEIPRMLTLSDCGYRILFTKYDHFSNNCKSYYPRTKKKEAPEPELPVIEEKKEEEVKEEKKEGEEGEQEGADKEDTEDLMAMLQQMKGEGGEEEKKEEQVTEEKEEEAAEEFEDPITPEPTKWEDFDEDEDVVDLRANHVLGGIFHFNLVNLPPQPKVVNNWIITRLVDPPEIEYMDYMADIALPNKDGQSPSQEKVQEKSTEASKRDEKPPIGVTMKLPEDVLFTEEPQIARWDYKHNSWRMDGFSDFNYNEENRTFHFKTTHFGTLALLQDAHINMPFQSWEIRPHRQNAAVLTIIAAIIEIEIEIKDSLCCLSKPEDKPELEHIRNRWMTPKELVRTLRTAGVNVFPADDSSKYVSIQNKHCVIEDWCYEQMAMVSSAVAFSWSKWNSDTEDKEKVLFQGAESLQDEPLMEEDWGLFMMTKRRSMKLKMTEFDETYNEDLADGSMFKSNLYHMMMETVTDQAKDRIRETNSQFADCVAQILAATRVLTYA